MIKTNKGIVFSKEGFYERLVQREARMDAEIRDRRRQVTDETWTDLPGSAVRRIQAHIRRRNEHRSKDKWVKTLKEYTKTIAGADNLEKERMRRLLRQAREAAERI